MPAQVANMIVPLLRWIDLPLSFLTFDSNPNAAVTYAHGLLLN